MYNVTSIFFTFTVVSDTLQLFQAIWGFDVFIIMY